MKRTYLLRTARNLLLAALAALLIWWTAGFPLPTPELTFRRAERQALAERSELIWQYEGTAGGDKDLLVGLANRFVHVWHPNGYVLFWPRQEGGTLVPLPAETRYQDRGSSYTGPALLVPDPPEGAESVEELYERTGSFLEELCSRQDLAEKNILVSTHGAAMTALLNRINGKTDIAGTGNGNIPLIVCRLND